MADSGLTTPGNAASQASGSGPGVVVPLVEVDRPAVGVNDGLDRVAHVVDLVGRQRGVGRVGVSASEVIERSESSRCSGSGRWSCSRRGST